MALFDPKTFTYDQLNALTNTPGESLATSNTPEQIKKAQSLTMTPESLANATPLDIPPQDQTPIYDTTALESQMKDLYALTQQEEKISSATSGLMDTYNQLIGKTSDTAKLQQESGIGQIEQAYSDLGSQLNTLIAERKAIPLSVEGSYLGREVPASIVSAKTNQALRQNAVAALGVSALMDATKGRLDAAQRKIDQSIEQKYGPIEARQQAYIKQLELLRNDPLTTQQDRMRTAKQLAVANRAAQITDQRKADSATIQKWAMEALSNGATVQQAQEIMNLGKSESPDVFTAFRLFSPFSKDPVQTQKDMYDLAIKREQLNKAVNDNSSSVLTGGPAGSSLDQLSFLRTTAQQAKDLSGASGRSGLRRTAESWFVGSSDYTQLEALTNTLRTNVLTLTTNPDIKKFFGPQMSEADVRLMTAAGTTLNPQLQSPKQLKSEIERLDELLNRMQTSVRQGYTTGGNVITAPDGQLVEIID